MLFLPKSSRVRQPVCRVLAVEIPQDRIQARGGGISSRAAARRNTRWPRQRTPRSSSRRIGPAKWPHAVGCLRTNCPYSASVTRYHRRSWSGQGAARRRPRRRGRRDDARTSCSVTFRPSSALRPHASTSFQERMIGPRYQASPATGDILVDDQRALLAVARSRVAARVKDDGKHAVEEIGLVESQRQQRRLGGHRDFHFIGQGQTPRARPILLGDENLDDFLQPVLLGRLQIRVVPDIAFEILDPRRRKRLGHKRFPPPGFEPREDHLRIVPPLKPVRLPPTEAINANRFHYGTATCGKQPALTPTSLGREKVRSVLSQYGHLRTCEPDGLHRLQPAGILGTIPALSLPPRSRPKCCCLSNWSLHSH